MNSYQQFFAELKRRKVFRVMAVYGIVGFIVLQVVDLAVPALLLPEWTYRLVALILLVGFPIAIVLAWAFEQTPEGLKRTERADPGEIEAIVAEPASRRWPAGLLALAGAVLLFGAWWMGRQGSGSDLNLAILEAAASDFREIAVLPFQDLGGNEENDPFLSGLHADIHRKLLGLADLRVTSLGSVGTYGSLEQDAREIAGELDVDYLVRGSVRRAGGRVRVDVYLVDAAANEDLWSEQFDAEVRPENLFDVQTNIAREVADRLVADLTPDDVEDLESNLSSDDLAALTWYHRALRAWSDGARGGEYQNALSFAERAVELDPTFAEAWSLLARIRSALSVWEGGAAGALAALEETERLAPGSVAALKARAAYEANILVDRRSALETYRAIESQVPSDAEAVAVIGGLEAGLGDFREAALTLRRAVQLDPRNPSLLNLLAAVLDALGRYAAADRVAERALQIDPGNTAARVQKVGITLTRRGPDAARSLAAELGLTPDIWEEAVVLRVIAIYNREFDVAESIMERMPADTLNLEEVNRLAFRADTRLYSGGDPAAFGDSLLALDLSEMPAGLAPISRVIRAAGLVWTGSEERGWDEIARAAQEAGEASSAVSVWNSSAILSIAVRMYARYGRYDDMLEILEAHIDRPAIQFPATGLRLDPVFDGIRADPRFQAVLRKRVAYEEQAARDAEAEGPWLP